MVKINGAEHNAAGVILGDYLEQNGYERERIAVEINLEIVPKAAYDTTSFADGDEVEIVSFVGGG